MHLARNGAQAGQVTVGEGLSLEMCTGDMGTYSREELRILSARAHLDHGPVASATIELFLSLTASH